MTNDFEVAIEEGATMVRIGTAIFGKESTVTRRHNEGVYRRRQHGRSDNKRNS